MKASIISITVAVLIVGCGTDENRSHIADEVTNNTLTEGIAFHSSLGWAQQVPFYVSSDATDQVVEASIAAAQSWNDALGEVKLAFQGISDSDRGDQLYSSLDDSITVIYFESQWAETTGKSETTLATTVWENNAGSDEIIKGDIILNSQVYAYQDSMVSPSDSQKSIVDTESVMLHEFGHLLGLDHVSKEDDSESIMHATTFIGANIHSRKLSEGDIENIRSIYSN